MKNPVMVWAQLAVGLISTALVAYVMVMHHERTALFLYGGLSLVAAFMYALDKKSAAQGSVRVSESTLHLLALLGGWPGMLIVGPLLKHKVRKGGFLLRLWGIASLHVAFWGWLLATKQTLAAWLAHLVMG